MALGGLVPLEFLAKMREGSVPQRVSNVAADYKAIAIPGGVLYT